MIDRNPHTNERAASSALRMMVSGSRARLRFLCLSRWSPRGNRAPIHRGAAWAGPLRTTA